jgi:multidrug transporter EmrE-like cation transporter
MKNVIVIHFFCWYTLNKMTTLPEFTGYSLVLTFAVLIAVVESFAQNSLKQSQMYQSPTRFYLGLCFYLGVGYILHRAYHTIGLGKMNLVWSCISIVAGLSAGYLLYDEPINKYTAAAVCLALSAIYVAHLGDNVPH